MEFTPEEIYAFVGAIATAAVFIIDRVIEKSPNTEAKGIFSFALTILRKLAKK